MHLSVNGAVYANGLQLGNRRPGCVRLVTRNSLPGASEGETCIGECLPWVPLEQWGMCISVWNEFCRAMGVKGWDWVETSGKTVPCWSSQGRETSDQHLSSSWDVPITELGALFTYLFMSFNPQGNFWIQAVITPFHRGKKMGIQRDNCWRSLGRNSRIWTQGLYQSSIYELGSCFISQDLFLSSRMDFDIGQTWFQVSFSNYLDDIW